jgi:uncharacterized protein YggE
LTTHARQFIINAVNALVKQLTVPFLTVLLTLALLYIFTSVLGPIPFSIKSTTTTTSDLFSVNGVGEEKAVADKAQFTVGVTKTATTAEAAKEQVNTATNAIIEQLKALGIEDKDLKTLNFNSFPNQDFNRGNTVTGYTVSQDLQVTANSIDVANQALDTAVANGANQIAGVSFTVNDDDKKALEQKASKKAIADAKSKAQEIAAEAGIKLGKVVNIYVTDNQVPPMPYDAKLETMNRAVGSAEPTDLQPGENTVTINVTLSYETL